MNFKTGNEEDKLKLRSDLESLHFVSKRLWIRIGAPWNLDAKLNGKPTPLSSKTGDFVVTGERVTQAQIG